MSISGEQNAPNGSTESANGHDTVSIYAEKSSIDLGKLILEALEERLKERGRVNVLIAGKTGVGKSTLVNAVFQGNMATTGQGRPITSEMREIHKEGIPLRILDTRGLELGNKEYLETFNALRTVVQSRKNSTDPNEHIHVAWICLTEDSRRVEESESRLATMLDEEGVPVIAVITKARNDAGFRSSVQALMPEARNVVRVRAIQETIEGFDRPLEPMGLEELVDLTMEVVPEGQKNAFAAAQRVSLNQKKKRAHLVVVASVASAAAAGAVPIPFSDAALLVPIQVGMLAGISAVFGLDLGEGFLGTLVSGALGAGAGVMGGRAIVTNLLKMVPGAGTVAGGVIAAATAATITTTIGEAYMATLTALLKDNPERELAPEEVAKVFKSKIRMSGGSA